MFPERKEAPYIIEIAENAPYPFHLPKPEFFQTMVRVHIDFQEQLEIHSKVNKICTLNHGNLVQIKEVLESHHQKHYEITYEYIPYPVNHSSELFQAILKEKKYSQKLRQIIQELIDQGVRPKPHLQDFGFTQEGELKFYIRSDFQLLDQTLPQELKKGIADDIFEKCEQQFKKIDSTVEAKVEVGLKSKIQHLEDKIKKIRDNFQKNKQLRESHNNSMIKNESSESSDPQKKPPSNEVKPHSRYSGGEGQEHDNHFDQSYSCRDNRKEKKRTSSFKLVEKRAKSQSKHKLSWEGTIDFPPQDSDKTTVLRNRISEALHKTQKTLTKYEKVRGKSRRRRR